MMTAQSQAASTGMEAQDPPAWRVSEGSVLPHKQGRQEGFSACGEKEIRFQPHTIHADKSESLD